ncbi:MAG: hypothetical protein KGP13_04470 [Burkholderiales bacterium]|nr:hypothetical protein [Burkholderiales bacterium]
MAISWLSALKAIPWGNVIEHAPNVLDKARDLLDRQRKPQPTEHEEFAPSNSKDPSTHEQLENRLVDALHQIRLLQRKNELQEQKLADLANFQEALQKDIKAQKRAVRWILFFSLVVVFANLVLWFLYVRNTGPLFH